MIKIFDIYIVKKISAMFFFLTITFLLIVVFFDFIAEGHTFFQYGLNLSKILFYYLVEIPFIFNLIMPVIVFISSVFVILRLSNRCEIVSFLSLGNTKLRFLYPFIILFGGILVILLLIFCNLLLPLTNKKMYDFETKYLKGNVNSKCRDLHIKLSNNQFLYIESYDIYDQIGSNVWIDSFKKNQLVERMSSKYIKCDNKSKKWILEKCQKREYGDVEDTISYLDKYEISCNKLDINSFVIDTKTIGKLTRKELNTLIENCNINGSDNIVLFEIEKMKRIYHPFSVLILITMAVLFCSEKSRSGNKKKIIISFILAFSFIGISMFVEGFVKYSKTIPLFVLWLPNIVSFLFCFIFYLKKPA